MGTRNKEAPGTEGPSRVSLLGLLSSGGRPTVPQKPKGDQMNFDSTSQGSGGVFDPRPGDIVMVVAYEMALPAVVLGSGTDPEGQPVYRVFLTASDDREDLTREFYVHRHELAEV